MKKLVIATVLSVYTVGCGSQTPPAGSSTSTLAMHSSVEQSVQKTLIPIAYEVTGGITPFGASASVSASDVPESFEKAQELIHTIFPSSLQDFHRITGTAYNGTGLVLMGQDEEALKSAQDMLTALGVLVIDARGTEYLRHSAVNLREKVAIRFYVLGDIVPLAKKGAASSAEDESESEGSELSAYNLTTLSEREQNSDPCSVVAPRSQRAMEAVKSRYSAERFGLNGTGVECFDTLALFVKSDRQLQRLRDAMKSDNRLMTVSGLDIFNYQEARPAETSSVKALANADRECGKMEVIPSTFGNFYELNNNSGTFGVVDNEAPFAASPLSAGMHGKEYCFDVSQRIIFPEIDAKAIEISGYQLQSQKPNAMTKCGEWEPLLTISGWNYNLRVSDTEGYGLVDNDTPKVVGGFARLNNYRGRVCVGYTAITEGNLLEVSTITIQ